MFCDLMVSWLYVVHDIVCVPRRAIVSHGVIWYWYNGRFIRADLRSTKYISYDVSHVAQVLRTIVTCYLVSYIVRVK